MTQAQIPKVSMGSIIHYPDLGKGHPLARSVDVWLPPNYDSSQRYPVLYMHDGQMLFDSSITWNHQSWQVAETVSDLIQQKMIRPVIVVGVWNSGAGRHADYFPQQPFMDLTEEDRLKISQARRTDGSEVFQRIAIRSDDYLDYLVQVVKDFVDEHYPTWRDKKNCFIAGSSMGGLISLYALGKYPETFGGAACLSTHWPGIFQVDENPFPESYFRYLKTNLPEAKSHRIYFDLGTATLDSMYAPYQLQVDGIMRSKGYTSSDWQTQIFEGDDHSERSWSGRLKVPLAFLLHQ